MEEYNVPVSVTPGLITEDLEEQRLLEQDFILVENYPGD
jgi:hypothetical protein